MEYITKDTHLDFSEDGTTYKELYGMKGYPDMGSAPEKKEVSNMRDGNKRYINGLTDTGSLEFDFFYNRDTDSDSGNVLKNAFSAMKKAEKDDKLLHWKLTYPDNSSYSWQGKPSAYITSGQVGDPISFKLAVSVESALTYNEGTATGGETT